MAVAPMAVAPMAVAPMAAAPMAVAPMAVAPLEDAPMAAFPHCGSVRERVRHSRIDAFTHYGSGRRVVVVPMNVLDSLVRIVRVLHGTIGITEPPPAQERAIALLWLALCLLLAGVFVVGLFVIG